ncbi:MAG TPA: hypothetical protein VF069_08615 [Streptosporangiaceae bacterium]
MHTFTRRPLPAGVRRPHARDIRTAQDARRQARAVTAVEAR